MDTSGIVAEFRCSATQITTIQTLPLKWHVWGAKPEASSLLVMLVQLKTSKNTAKTNKKRKLAMTDCMMFADKGPAEAKVCPWMCQNQGHPCWQSVTVKMAAGEMFPKKRVAKWPGLVAHLFSSILSFLSALADISASAPRILSSPERDQFGKRLWLLSENVSANFSKDSFPKIQFLFPKLQLHRKKWPTTDPHTVVAASSLTRIPNLGA